MKKKFCTSMIIFFFILSMICSFNVTAYEQNPKTSLPTQVQEEQSIDKDGHLVYLFLLIGAICAGVSYRANKKKSRDENNEKLENESYEIWDEN